MRIAHREGAYSLTKENDSSRKPSTTVSTSRSKGGEAHGEKLILLCYVIKRDSIILGVYNALDNIYIANEGVDFRSFSDR